MINKPAHRSPGDVNRWVRGGAVDHSSAHGDVDKGSAGRQAEVDDRHE